MELDPRGGYSSDLSAGLWKNKQKLVASEEAGVTIERVEKRVERRLLVVLFLLLIGFFFFVLCSCKEVLQNRVLVVTDHVMIAN